MDASSGEFFLSIDIESSGNSFSDDDICCISLPLNLTVNSVYKISATATSAIEVEGQPGDTVYFQFDVKNMGNSNDTI